MAKQTEIPDAGKLRKIPALHKAAIHYAEVRDTRMEWTDKEVEAMEPLAKLMEQHKSKLPKDGKGRHFYKVAGVTATLVPPEGKSKVKVRVSQDDPEAAD